MPTPTLCPCPLWRAVIGTSAHRIVNTGRSAMIFSHPRQGRRAVRGTGHDLTLSAIFAFVPRTKAGFLLFRARPHDPGSRPVPALSGAGLPSAVIRPHPLH